MRHRSVRAAELQKQGLAGKEIGAALQQKLHTRPSRKNVSAGLLDKQQQQECAQ